PRQPLVARRRVVGLVLQDDDPAALRRRRVASRPYREVANESVLLRSARGALVGGPRPDSEPPPQRGAEVVRNLAIAQQLVRLAITPVCERRDDEHHVLAQVG